MISRITRILLIIQAGIAAALCYAMTKVLGADYLWLAMTCSVLAVLFVRMLITANNFWLAWLYRSATPEAYQLNYRQAWKMYWTEFRSTMLTSSWAMPFKSFSRYTSTSACAIPVLLIHGYGCNSGYWHALSRQLRQAGITHHAVSMTPVFGDIDSFTPVIHEAVEALCRDTQCDKIIIVAHSMGGLVARAYLCSYGDTRIAKVITLGTPHHGTGLAHFGLGKNSQQMRWIGTATEGAPNDWLKELAQRENPAIYARFVSIYSHHDNIIAPQESSFLPGARNVAYYGIGHVALGLDPRIHAKIIEEIQSTTTEPAVTTGIS